MLIEDFTSNYQDDPITFFNFDPKKLENIDVYLGIKSMERFKKSSKPSVYIDFEAPNYSTIIDERPNYYNFDYIVSICPYTTAYQNTLKNNHFSCYFPIHPINLKNIRKKFDVIYTGQMHSTKLEQLLSVMTDYRYVNVSFTKSKLVTHRNISYAKKMKLVSQSRVSIIHNLVFPNYPLSDYPQALALGFNSKNNVYPQLKSRAFEAAICKSLMLVLKDDYNIIENYFTPDSDFIYFSNKNELEYLISDAKNNPNKYESTVTNAYNKCVSLYAVENFLTDFIYPLSNKI
jgi:hypothetical protein